MKRREIGEYLYLYYQNRKASFLMNAFKSSLTNDRKDIHRARLDAKKMFAIFDLLEIIDKEEFRQKKARKLFQPVYKQAGILRELQVSYLVMNQEGVLPEDISEFFSWVSRKEERVIKNFVHQVDKLNHINMEGLDDEMKWHCTERGIFNLKSRSESYFRHKLGQIKKILAQEPGEEEIHRIRKILKSVSTIATLVYSIKPEIQLDKLITILNQTEMMIGDWHDLVVLQSYIHQFMGKAPSLEMKEEGVLKRLLQDLSIKSSNLADHFLPEVKKISEFN
jgi:CHAD domain-containing protein